MAITMATINKKHLLCMPFNGTTAGKGERLPTQASGSQQRRNGTREASDSVRGTDVQTALTASARPSLPQQSADSAAGQSRRSSSPQPPIAVTRAFKRPVTGLNA